MTGVLPLRLETSDGIARTILEMELFGLGFDYISRYPAVVNALTPEYVNEVANARLSDGELCGLSGGAARWRGYRRASPCPPMFPSSMEAGTHAPPSGRGGKREVGDTLKAPAGDCALHLPVSGEARYEAKRHPRYPGRGERLYLPC